MTGVLTLYRTSIGKKAIMAMTGFILVAFVFVHMIGNLKIFLGESHLNDYAHFLRVVGEPVAPTETVLWLVRIVLLASVFLHVWSAIQLGKQSMDSRPQSYVEKKTVQASYASLTMRYGGAAIALFVIYHILHFTTGQAHPAFSTNVYHNVITGFQNPIASIIYILAMCAVSLHIYHGGWSMFQTLGVNARKSPIFRTGALLVALAIFVGDVSIPVAVMLGFLK